MESADENETSVDVGWGEPTKLWCSLDMEFEYFVVRERLSAQLAEVRRACPVPTTALRDGSAKARRDERINRRLTHHTPSCARGEFPYVHAR